MPARRPTSGFTFLDLFAGIGGFHHALTSLGGRCVMACEIDPECRAVYRASFPDVPSGRIVADIRSLTEDANGKRLTADRIADLVPQHDVLCAGFPCQPFSKSGAQLGVRDRTRGTLFFEIMEIARALKPRFMVLENVRNLAGPRHVGTWRTIIESLRDASYRVADEPVVLSPHLLPPHQGGAPQVRDRVFILCEYVGSGSDRSLTSPPLLRRDEFESEWDPNRWHVSSFVRPDARIQDIAEFRLSESERAWVEAWDTFVREIPTDALPGFPIWAFALRARASIPSTAPDWERTFLLRNAEFYRSNRKFLDDWMRRRWGKEGQQVLDFPRSRQKFEWQARKAHPTRNGRTLRDLVLQLRPSGIRVKPATYLPALVAITQTSVIGPGVAPGVSDYRRLTPEEAAHLQGIPPETFARAGVSRRAAYKQLGNAVNVGVARLATQRLMDSVRAPDSAELTGLPLFARRA